MKVDFTTIEPRGRGEDSGYCTPSRMVIRNEREWEKVWLEHLSNINPPLGRPKVDFTREMVVAVFAGEKPTSGYPVEIIAVDTQDSQLVVTVRYRQPSTGAGVMDVVTCPYHMVRMPRRDEVQVVFKRA